MSLRGPNSALTEAVSLRPRRDGTARIWDAISGKQLFVFQPVGNFPTAIFSPSGNQVLTTGENSAVSLWDARTGVKVLSEDERGSSATAFSPDGGSFATSQGFQGGASDFVVSIWNAADGRLKQALPVRTWPYSVAVQPGRKPDAGKCVGADFIRQSVAPF